jgi:hypothetical protein
VPSIDPTPRGQFRPRDRLMGPSCIRAIASIAFVPRVWVGCVIGAAGDSATAIAHWSMNHAPGFVQRWFGWQAA